MHRHVVDVAAPLVIQAILADRAEIALDVDAETALEVGAQIFGNQVQRVLVHRAALDGVGRALIGLAVLFQAALDERDQRGLAAADRPDEHQNALANVQAARLAGFRYSSTNCCRVRSTPYKSSSKNLYLRAPRFAAFFRRPPP